MSKFSATQKLVVENFPDQREWISPMFSVLNKFIQDSIKVLTNGISFADNIQGKEYESDFVFVNNTTSLPKVRWDILIPPKALSVVSAYEAVPPATGDIANAFSPVIILVAWALDAQNFVQLTDAVKVNSIAPVAGVAQPAVITGLVPSNRYKIKVRITP